MKVFAWRLRDFGCSSLYCFQRLSLLGCRPTYMIQHYIGLGFGVCGLGFATHSLANVYFSKRDYSDEQLKWLNKIGYGLWLVFILLPFGIWCFLK